MQRWLQECELNHPHCKPNMDGLPKRLINVGSPTQSFPNLVYTEDLDPQSVRYATLSYCWGKSKTFTTTKATESSYLKKIPLESLPQTIRDALSISQSLKIPYLWVDALCIVQDDESDWQVEITKMADVYFGSTLTIAASDARDSSGGFHACSSASGPHKMDINNQAFLVIERPKQEPDLLLQVQPRGRSSNGIVSALHTRGWTLQEMVLSHRIVQVQQSELHWRCRSAWWTEAGVSYDLSSTIYGNVPLLGNIRLSDPSLTWWKWMENYSSRSLTFLKDRIPAIIGLLDYHQKRTADISVLGLWKSSLHRDLLWMRLSRLPDDHTTPTDLLKFPTWSWLSCPAQILFDFFSHHMEKAKVHDHITINEYELSWTGKPYVSDIKSSMLVITGPAKEAYLEMAPEGEGCNPPYFNVDHEIPNFAEHPLPWRCAAQFDREQRRSPQRWLCLLVRTRVDIDTAVRVETFLILEPVYAVADEQTFRRIGLGSFKGYSDSFDLSMQRTINLV
jgi:hypothetical protein